MHFSEKKLPTKLKKIDNFFHKAMRCVAAFRNFRDSSIINARLRYDDQLHNQRVMEIIAPGYSTRDCGRPWPAAYINIIQNTHQIRVLTEALCRAQAIFYSLPNNE